MEQNYGPDFISIFLTAAVSALLIYIYFRRKKRDTNYPPGPAGLPLVGYAPFLGENPCITYMNLAKKYGPIFSLEIGTSSWIVLNDYDVITQALVKEGKIFSGRPKLHVFEIFGGGMGIVFADYNDSWKSQKKFGMSTLRGFGVGRRSFETKILEEIDYFLETIKLHGRSSMDCQSILSNAVSNIICNVLTGTRFSYEDDRFVKIVACIKQNVTDKLFAIMTLAPFTRFLPFFRGSYNRYLKNVKFVKGILGDIIEKHKEVFDENNLHGFIDQMLQEMKRANGVNSFNERQILLYIHDLFAAGSETSSTTLRWCILGLAAYPEYQNKLSKEMKRVIGESGIPSMKHREQMPYMCAFIQEIMRHRCVVPLALPHKTNANIKFRGFYIPKDTPIMPNIWSVHYDPNLFQDPELFHPERFIDSSSQFVYSNHVIPFSVGPRICLGEQLVKMEIFLFLTSILQKFEIVVDPSKPLPPFDDGIFGAVYSPQPFEVSFLPR